MMVKEETLNKKAEQYCKDNVVLNALFSTKHGNKYLNEILVEFSKTIANDKLDEAAKLVLPCDREDILNLKFK
jgi:hypothetical protein